MESSTTSTLRFSVLDVPNKRSIAKSVQVSPISIGGSEKASCEDLAKVAVGFAPIVIDEKALEVINASATKVKSPLCSQSFSESSSPPPGVAAPAEVCRAAITPKTAAAN